MPVLSSSTFSVRWLQSSRCSALSCTTPHAARSPFPCSPNLPVLGRGLEHPVQRPRAQPPGKVHSGRRCCTYISPYNSRLELDRSLGETALLLPAEHHSSAFNNSFGRESSVLPMLAGMGSYPQPSGLLLGMGKEGGTAGHLLPSRFGQSRLRVPAEQRAPAAEPAPHRHAPEPSGGRENSSAVNHRPKSQQERGFLQELWKKSVRALGPNTSTFSIKELLPFLALCAPVALT